MKIWFTRPSTWDLIVRGIERCDMWLQKPFYDTHPRGPEQERCPIYQSLPLGWRVVDPVYGDVSHHVRITVREIMSSRLYEEVADALWEALCRSVDGKGPTEGGLAPRRWMDRDESDADREEEAVAESTFLFEFDAPPNLWFNAAILNGLEYQTAEGRWAQKFFPMDDELGIDVDEPPPVKNPPIRYDGSEALLEGRSAL
ncbi:hypothetical protein F6X40_17485 [Paraburkholderia sp. UCT31]|uniref:hypothetical protein n=1 Tax=Paraburkholderia sp. UCT31 TaxID=2615209 RepID=UPI0016562BB3|nr:hypothetical protein [Paraburkholderia sp. UCT31]MBC8738554.1 hypothetical protein [Paraburkholderia sp. UCT31]